MAPVVSWTLLALAAALVVIVVGGLAAGGRGGIRQFVADLRSGLRRENRHQGPGVLEEWRTVAEDDDASVDDLFSLGRSDAPAYLSAERLEHVVGRVSRAVPRQRDVAHRTVPEPGPVDDAPAEQGSTRRAGDQATDGEASADDHVADAVPAEEHEADEQRTSPSI